MSDGGQVNLRHRGLGRSQRRFGSGDAVPNANTQQVRTIRIQNGAAYGAVAKR